MVDQPPDPEVYVAKRPPSNYALGGTCAPSPDTGTAISSGAGTAGCPHPISQAW